MNSTCQYYSTNPVGKQTQLYSVVGSGAVIVLVYFTGSNVMTERVITLNLQPWQFVAAVDVTV